MYDEKLFDYSDYGLPIPKSDEVLDYEERCGHFLDVDWRGRAHQHFETRSPLTRLAGLGALACSMTQRELKHQIQELEAHFKLELVPDYIDF